LGIAVHHERGHEHGGPGRDEVAADRLILHRPPLDAPRGRVEPHRLEEHGFGVRQPGRIIRASWRAVEGVVDLGVEALLDLRMERELIPRPVQPVGGRLVARGDERERLVAHLLVGHAGAVSLQVAGREQDREQVAVGLAARRAPLGDDAPGCLFELGDPLLEAPDAGKRRVQEHRKEGDRQVVEELADLGHRAPDALGVGVELGAEERPRDDPQGELGHVGGHVARLAVVPGGARAARLVQHDPGVRVDHAPVERRLEHPPLAQVEVALARQEAVSEHDLRPLEPGALLERALVGHQHLAGQVGPHDDEDMLRADAEVDEIAVPRPQLGHDRGGIAVKAGQDAERARRTGAWRETVRGDQGAIFSRPASHAATVARSNPGMGSRIPPRGGRAGAGDRLHGLRTPGARRRVPALDDAAQRPLRGLVLSGGRRRPAGVGRRPAGR
jgi:hypothetical protein